MQTADFSVDFVSPHNARTPWYVAHKRWYPGLLLMLLAVIASLPALRGGYVLDDDLYVTQNRTLHSADGFRRIWLEIGAEPDYYALVYSTFWLEYHLWGLAPLGYHAVNVALHALSALLLWRLLVRLRVPGSWLAAAVFAVHPVCVESIAWITERKNTLSLPLALASMLCYLRFEPAEVTTTAAESGDRCWRYYVAALLLFAAALLSKTAVVAVPPVLLVIYWWKRGSINRRTAAPLTPLFALALAMGVMTIWVETAYNGAHGADWQFSPLERLLIAGRALSFYAGKLIWPHPLAFFYPRWNIDAGQWWQYLYPASVLLTLALLWLARNKIGRGPVAAALIFAGVLLPAVGFVNTCYMRYYFVADHLQYQAMATLIALATAAGWTVVNRRCQGPMRSMAVAAAATVLGTFMVLSWRQCQLYADSLTLNQDVLAKNPDSWLAHHNVGVALIDAGKYQEAIEHYQAALRLRPNFPEAENDLGYVLLVLGNAPQAMEHFQSAVRMKPDYSEAYNNLGNVNKQLGKFDDAIACYEKALALNPQSVQAHSNLGSTLRQCGRLAEAIKQYEAALAIEPNLPVLHNNLANTLVVSGRVPEAIQHYQTAIHLEHDYVEAYLNLASTYAGGKQMDAALATADKALAIANATGQIQQAQKIEAWIAARRSWHVDPNVAPASAAKSDPLFKY